MPTSADSLSAEALRGLYLGLMKKVLTNWVYAESELIEPRSTRLLVRLACGAVRSLGLRLVRPQVYDPLLRSDGRDWPPFAHSMIGMKRLDNIQMCVESVLREEVPGDLIETGVWRGGAVIFMRALLGAYGVKDRKVWVADSFSGLPAPDPKYPADRGFTLHEEAALAVPLEEVKANFQKYGLLDAQVEFLKGWFADTLPKAPIDKLAVLRLDGDLYGSTMDALQALYAKLSPGGYVIVDDYGVSLPCRQAVEDFKKERGITEPVVPVDGSGVYWRRAA
jgi:hypothetical protein